MRKWFSGRLAAVSTLVVFALSGQGTVTAHPEGRLPPKTHAVPQRTDAVVYTRNGDLYTCDLPRGTSRRLTHNGGNFQPAWSPDGNWIAYFHVGPTDAQQLCLIRRDGSAAHVLLQDSDSQPTYSFSPRTAEIAVVTSRGDLAITPLAKNTLRRVVFARTQNNKPLKVSGVSWSPDGKSLAYTMECGKRYDAKAKPGEPDYRVSLWQIQTSRGKGANVPRLLYVSRQHHAVPYLGEWSPDSRYLLFWALEFFPGSSMNADGLPLYACAITPGGTKPGKAHCLFGNDPKGVVLKDRTFVSFAPQSHQLVASVGGSRFSARNKRLIRMDLEKDAARVLTPSALAATYPAWSPNGKQIAYLACPDAGNAWGEALSQVARQTRLQVMNADGTENKHLAASNLPTDAPLYWLSDGSTILFERHASADGKSGSAAEEQEGLWTINTDGTGLRCIAHLNDSISDSTPFAFWSSRR